jgi:hypothetical protein
MIKIKGASFWYKTERKELVDHDDKAISDVNEDVLVYSFCMSKWTGTKVNKECAYRL